MPAAAGTNHGWTAARGARLGVLAAALLVLLPSLARANDYDRWYAIEMAGQRAGWMHNQQTTSGDRITTSNELTFRFGRGKEGAGVSIRASFVETAAGK